VRRDLLGAARLLVVPTIALLGVALFAPGRLEIGVRIYALILCLSIIVLVLLALRRAYPPESILRPHAAAADRRIAPASLVHLENEAALGVASSFDLHYRLVPRLRSIADGLLSSRRRVSLAGAPDAARAILGERAWELVRSDRAAPDDRLAKGIAADELARAVDALEAV
jgi:hypothetical protein